MNATPLTEQVGRLVGNLLAGGGEVFLPGAGTLYTERRPARRIDRRFVQPPCRVVSFSSQQRGVSLVDEIARIMREGGAASEADSQTAAQEVYDRWIARALEADRLTVEGVGVLAFKNFTPDEAFERRLNPQGREPVKIRAPRRFDWALWLGVAAIAVALVYGGREFLMFSAEPDAVAVETVGAERTEPAVPAGAPDALAEASQPELPVAGEEPIQPAGTVSPGVSDAFGTETMSGTETTPAAEPQAGPEKPQTESGEPASLLSGHHYVVLGVFSTVENARRAQREFESEELRCRIYRFGGKFMVSPFSSDESGPCKRFIGSHAEQFPGMWTYTAR